MLNLKNIEKTYGKGDAAVPALRGATLNIAEKEMVAIMGKSGSGKSTLLNVMGGLVSFDAGEYCYKKKALNLRNTGQMLAFRRNEVGFILQHFGLLNEYTVCDNVMMALRYKKMSKHEMRKNVEQTLDELELHDKLHAYPQELSGGQKQRIAIARAIVKNPSIILADEPTGALDSSTEKTVLNLLCSINAAGKTVVMVTHDETVAARCQRVVCLQDGKVICAG